MSQRPAALGALIVVLVGGVVLGVPPRQVGAAAATTVVPEHITSLSPYWRSQMQRWTPLITQEAQRREFDPDFVAALIWKESRGDPNAIGPAGSVGLMQVMPKEAGFSWRPTTAALLDPSLNVAWGTRTLSIIVGQGKGDLYAALAAYNGGWARSTYRGPTAFAASILLDYASAVAVRHGVVGAWTAYLAAPGEVITGPVYRIDPEARTVTRQDVDGADHAIPPIPPVVRAAHVVDEEAAATYTVGLWMFSEDEQSWLGVRPEPASLSSVDETVDGEVAADALSESHSFSAPALMAGSGPVGVPAENDADTPSPTDGMLAGVQPVAPAACGGGPLKVDAWPLERWNTEDGWRGRVYVEGRGGNCSYTYAWNDASDVKGEALPGSLAFEVHSPRRGDVILGTVVVASGEETVRVGLYILPPGD